MTLENFMVPDEIDLCRLAILLAMTAAIWYPFLVAYDRQCLKQEEEKKENSDAKGV